MKKENRVEDKYILNECIPLNVQEAYKGVRTNIEFVLDKEGCKKIMISGPEIGVGSTTTCINLAASFAQAGKSTLIIDCDLRNLELNTLLQETNAPGLTEFLLKDVKLDAIIQKSGYDHLDIVCVGRGTAHPSEILSTEKFKSLMQQLEQKYEYIFVNTSPINLVADGRILASQMDGVVIVVKQDETTHKELEEMLGHLKKVNATILGTVLNGCRVSRKEKRKYKVYNKVDKHKS